MVVEELAVVLFPPGAQRGPGVGCNFVVRYGRSCWINLSISLLVGFYGTEDRGSAVVSARKSWTHGLVHACPRGLSVMTRIPREYR